MNKAEFEKWVDKMLAEYTNKIRRFDIAICEYNGTVLCGDSKTGKCGMARCHPEDKFNYSYGKAIAYARCRGYDVPKLTTYKKITDMKYGDKFKGITTNNIYSFIGKSTTAKRYIVESITHSYTAYIYDMGQEFEMVE